MMPADPTGTMKSTTALSVARVFRALDLVNIRMISQGASLLNLSLVVAETDLKRAVEALHREFFAQLDANVFERNGAADAAA